MKYWMMIGALFGASLAQAVGGLNNIRESTVSSIIPTFQNTAATGMTIQYSSAAIAFQYIAKTTSPVSGFDCSFSITGSLTGQQFQGYFESDASNAPSGTILGSATPSFSGPSVTKWDLGGIQSFASNSGALTMNGSYWVVISSAGSTAPTAANYIQLNELAVQYDGGYLRQFNGANWTTTAAVTLAPDCILEFADGHYEGVISTGTNTQLSGTSGGSRIYQSHVQSFCTRPAPGTMWKVKGASVREAYGGAPTDLVASLYSGNTLVTTSTAPRINIVSNNTISIWFTPTWVNSSANVCVVLSESGAGGSSSNYYDSLAVPTDSQYFSVENPANTGFWVGNSGPSPSSQTMVTTAMPAGFGFILDDISKDEMNIPTAVGY